MDSILKTDSENRLLEICEKTLGPRGFRTVDVELHPSGRSIVRIFIERQMAAADTALQAESPAGASAPTVGARELGVSIEDCAQASRLIGEVLDTQAELIPGAYELEVSSPGLDRRLRTVADFEKVVGEDVKLKLVASIPGMGANPTAKLVRVEKDFILVLSQGKEVPVPLRTIKRANRVWHLK